MITDPNVDDLGAYDPEAFVVTSRPQPVVLRLRRGERFLASETIPILFDDMHRVLDEIAAEQVACEAFEASRVGLS